MKKKLIASLLCITIGISYIGGTEINKTRKFPSVPQETTAVVAPQAYELKKEEIKERNSFLLKQKQKQKELEEKTKEPEYINLGEFKITAYCSCPDCCGEFAYNRPVDENGNPIVYTSTGAIAQAHHTISVDTDIIPYGSEVYIGDELYVAEDCGGAIYGNKIDMYFDSHEEAIEYGVHYEEVKIRKED